VEGDPQRRLPGVVEHLEVALGDLVHEPGEGHEDRLAGRGNGHPSTTVVASRWSTGSSSSPTGQRSSWRTVTTLLASAVNMTKPSCGSPTNIRPTRCRSARWRPSAIVSESSGFQPG